MKKYKNIERKVESENIVKCDLGYILLTEHCPSCKEPSNLDTMSVLKFPMYKCKLHSYFLGAIYTVREVHVMLYGE